MSTLVSPPPPSATARFAYKCRLCGGVNAPYGLSGQAIGTPAVEAVNIIDNAFDGLGPEKRTLPMVRVHFCRTGQIGICDLAGAFHDPAPGERKMPGLLVEQDDITGHLRDCPAVNAPFGQYPRCTCNERIAQQRAEALERAQTLDRHLTECREQSAAQLQEIVELKEKLAASELRVAQVKEFMERTATELRRGVDEI